MLYSELPAFKRKVEQANRFVESVLSENLAFYVAFSGGKDSTVLLDMCQNIPAICWDDEWMLPETLDFIVKSGVKKVNIRSEHCEWFTSHKEVDTNSRDYVASQGWNACFLGLRADENSYRKKYFRKYGENYFSKARNQWNICPIAWWNVKDVWAYIFSKKIAFNQAYLKMFELGINPELQRIGPFANRRVLQYGQMHHIKRGWPDLFYKFAKEYPKVLEYV